MADRLKVHGLSRLRSTLRRAAGDLEDLKQANSKAANIVAAAARSSGPRRTGRLTGSVRGNRAAGRATVRAGGARLPYGGPIHWGWPARNIAAQPFISEAAQATESVWLPAYLDDIQNALDRVRGV